MLILGFVLAAVTMRFLPHAWNFTPVIAMLLLAGARMKRSQLWIPIAALVASDFLLNIVVYHAPGGADQYFTWAAYLMVLALAVFALSGRTRLAALAGTTIASSTIFFAVSNFGVWASGMLYPHTWSGLLTCYAMGVPFFRNAAAGDLLYTAAFFGLYEFLSHHLRSRVASADAA